MGHQLSVGTRISCHGLPPGGGRHPRSDNGYERSPEKPGADPAARVPIGYGRRSDEVELIRKDEVAGLIEGTFD